MQRHIIPEHYGEINMFTIVKHANMLTHVSVSIKIANMLGNLHVQIVQYFVIICHMNS